MGQRGVGAPRSGPPKKDRQGNQGIRREIGEEIRGGSATPVLQRDRNRDTARGDWDRTGRATTRASAATTKSSGPNGPTHNTPSGRRNIRRVMNRDRCS